jgi:hypothetical protein
MTLTSFRIKFAAGASQTLAAIAGTEPARTPALAVSGEGSVWRTYLRHVNKRRDRVRPAVARGDWSAVSPA